MNISDRVQHLRKSKGISQEELADKVGVSRQAVSKWESEQSIPEIDKIIIMSDYFEVTTDYILKGIENKTQSAERTVNANIFVIIATVVNLIGLLTSCAVWYEEQVSMALVIGIIFMALGCMIFGIGFISSNQDKEKAKHNFWIINIWLLLFIPLSFIYNIFFASAAAPYPLIGNSLILFFLYWLIYIIICSGVVYTQVKAIRK